ncbi:hypothetical protein NLJ89_g12277 [Agrocybe chaxingu]|uniref:Uncharacterized protein n=1 Tax=Agrocybe chaxingu TaxID=84603 RepID=A0A9W8JMT4_9AGAR|nr:hypothetical protein NLJ89_g12277 [Agrocybe chaxingu]
MIDACYSTTPAKRLVFGQPKKAKKGKGKAGDTTPDASDSEGKPFEHGLALGVFRGWFRRNISPRLNKIINQFLRDEGAWPQDIIVLQNNDDFPQPSSIAGLVTMKIGPRLLGTWGCNGNFTHQRLQPIVSALLIHAGSRLRKSWLASKNVLHGAEGLWVQLRLGMEPDIAKEEYVKSADLEAVINLISKIRPHLAWHPSLTTEVQEYEGYVMGLLESVGIEIDRTLDHMKDKKGFEKVTAARKRGLKKTLKLADLSRPEDVTSLLNRVIDHFKSIEPQGDEDTGIQQNDRRGALRPPRLQGRASHHMVRVH